MHNPMDDFLEQYVPGTSANGKVQIWAALKQQRQIGRILMLQGCLSKPLGSVILEESEETSISMAHKWASVAILQLWL